MDVGSVTARMIFYRNRRWLRHECITHPVKSPKYPLSAICTILDVKRQVVITEVDSIEKDD